MQECERSGIMKSVEASVIVHEKTNRIRDYGRSKKHFVASFYKVILFYLYFFNESDIVQLLLEIILN